MGDANNISELKARYTSAREKRRADRQDVSARLREPAQEESKIQERKEDDGMMDSAREREREKIERVHKGAVSFMGAAGREGRASEQMLLRGMAERRVRRLRSGVSPYRLSVLRALDVKDGEREAVQNSPRSAGQASSMLLHPTLPT